MREDSESSELITSKVIKRGRKTEQNYNEESEDDTQYNEGKVDRMNEIYRGRETKQNYNEESENDTHFDEGKLDRMNEIYKEYKERVKELIDDPEKQIPEENAQILKARLNQRQEVPSATDIREWAKNMHDLIDDQMEKRLDDSYRFHKIVSSVLLKDLEERGMKTLFHKRNTLTNKSSKL